MSLKKVKKHRPWWWQWLLELIHGGCVIESYRLLEHDKPRKL